MSKQAKTHKTITSVRQHLSAVESSEKRYFDVAKAHCDLMGKTKKVETARNQTTYLLETTKQIGAGIDDAIATLQTLKLRYELDSQWHLERQRIDDLWVNIEHIEVIKYPNTTEWWALAQGRVKFFLSQIKIEQISSKLQSIDPLYGTAVRMGSRELEKLLDGAADWYDAIEIERFDRKHPTITISEIDALLVDFTRAIGVLKELKATGKVSDNWEYTTILH